MKYQVAVKCKSDSVLINGKEYYMGDIVELSPEQAAQMNVLVPVETPVTKKGDTK
jgi:hypothetical protein